MLSRECEGRYVVRLDGLLVGMTDANVGLCVERVGEYLAHPVVKITISTGCSLPSSNTIDFFENRAIWLSIFQLNLSIDDWTTHADVYTCDSSRQQVMLPRQDLFANKCHTPR